MARRCSGSFPNRHAQLLDHPVAHDELLQLAGDRHGEFFDKADMVRHFVIGNLILAERFDFSLVGLLSLFKFYPGTELLTVFVVRHAEYCNILNLVITIQELLDFAGVDILAAAYHHVF